jgi:hypothetical protein
MPIGYKNAVIEYVTITWDYTTAEPVQTQTAISMHCSVQETGIEETGNYPGNRVDIQIVVELSFQPDVKNDRVRYNGQDYEISSYSQSTFFPRHYTLNCFLSRSNN